MKISEDTAVSHSHNADGTKRAKHCCGCWIVVLDLEIGWPYVRCNECGEHQWLSPPGTRAVDIGGAVEFDEAA